MNAIKRFFGLAWMAIGIIAIFILFKRAGVEFNEAKAGLRPLLDTRIFWYVIIPIFTPVMIGLCLFGYFAWKGEFGSNKTQNP